MTDKGDILYIGTPIALLVISLAAMIFVSIEVKKQRIDIKSLIVWSIVNLVYSVVLLYILIDAILQYYGISHSINIFTWVARNAFGFNFGNQEWVILLIFGFISFILVINMSTSIKTQKLNKRVDELNREIAILGGKVNKTANFSSNKVAINPMTLAEIKKELREEVKIARAKKKAKLKLKSLQATTTTNIKSGSTKETELSKPKKENQ